MHESQIITSRGSSHTVHKSHESKIQGMTVELSYCSSPYPQLNLKLVNPAEQMVYEIQLTKESLSRVDPAVLATFENVEAIYSELVQIVRSQPQDFQVAENGVIRVKITITMKSGTKKKQLVFQPNCRKMTETQKLKLQFQLLQQETKSHITQLGQQISLLTRQLEDVKKQNMQLKQTVVLLKQQQNGQLDNLRMQVSSLEQNLGSMKFGVKTLVEGGRKIILTVDKRSKCLKPSHKEDTFKLQNIEYEGNECINATKTGKDKWVQILFDQPIEARVSYFQFGIQRTKSWYICTGVCSKDYIDELDSKWSDKTITLFLLDNSIISEGKEVPNPSHQQNGAKEDHFANKKQTNIRVVVNCISEHVYWYKNELEIGRSKFSKQFGELCRGGSIRPLLICAHHDDSVILR